MSREFMAGVIQDSAGITQVLARSAANDLIEAITKELKQTGKFTLPGFGTFSVHKTKARTGLNPRTGEKIHIKAGKTVRFKVSKVLKQSM